MRRIPPRRLGSLRALRFGLAGLVAAVGAAGESEAALAESTAPKKAPRPALFVSPGGSDANSCRSRSAACASFSRAYRLAKPGQIVEVAGGTYPGQVIVATPGKARPNVVFRPATGARVILDGLKFGANGDPALGPKHVTVRGMETTYHTVGAGSRNQRGIWVGPGSSHITLANMDAGSVDSWFADHLKVIGGDYGPCNVVAFASNVCGNNKQDISRNVLINGALFHDYRFDASCFRSGADCHWECMYVNANVNFTIRNSRFRDCTLYNIFFTISGPEAARIGHRNLLVENNWFDTPWTETPSGGVRARATGISLAWCQSSPQGYSDVLVRFNSFQRNTGIELDRNMACTWRNVRVVGNLMAYPGNCDSRITYAYNVWSTALSRGRCVATDRIGGNAMPYANPTSGRGFNFRLRPKGRTIADRLVPSSVTGGCPRADIDRKRRVGKRCDAGSHQRSRR